MSSTAQATAPKIVRRTGSGYTLGPHAPKPIPQDAKFATGVQVCARYGGRSAMWLHRKIKNDPTFPKPVYDGRVRMFLVTDLDAYDHALILKRSA